MHFCRVTILLPLQGGFLCYMLPRAMPWASSRTALTARRCFSNICLLHDDRRHIKTPTPYFYIRVDVLSPLSGRAEELRPFSIPPPPLRSAVGVINIAACRYVYCPTGKSENCPLCTRWKNHFSKYGHPTIVTTTGLFLVFCLDEDETLRQ